MKQPMHFILPAMLMAAGGVQAQTAPVAQPAQPPPSMPASAAQTASCGGVANKTITAMSKGDFDGATQSFDPKAKPPIDKLQQTWGELTEKYGKPQSIGSASKGQMMQGYTVVLVPMQFEKGPIGAEAACSSSGRLVMLRFGLMPNATTSKS